MPQPEPLMWKVGMVDQADVVGAPFVPRQLRIELVGEQGAVAIVRVERKMR